MFDILTHGFRDAALRFKGQARLTEENIAEALEAVKRSLLDADVDLKVTKQFVEKVKEQCLNEVVRVRSKQSSISPGDYFIKACHDEIKNLLGAEQETKLIENPRGPTVILLVGLQGAGKTTHAAKIAKYFQENEKKRPLLVAADVYRPAAREQLKILGERIGVPVFSLDESKDAVSIAEQGMQYARNEWRDLVIIDTAGRLAIDETLMQELENIKRAVEPQNIWLTIDAMIGQDAVRTASAFDMRLGLTGVVLTKLDGDTRGGAALSVKAVTGKSIVFIGTGEGLDRLEKFRPDGMATRILGMGDIVGLVQDFTKTVKEEEILSQSERLMKGIFTFDDFLNMLGVIEKMGPLKDIASKMPLPLEVSPEALRNVDDRQMVYVRAIVQSMTKQEREKPELLLPKSATGRSRIMRIAKGSGRSEKEVREIVERFMQMRDMLQMFTGGLGGGLLGELGKVPGLASLNKLASMAKLAKYMGGSGLGGLGGLGFPGLDGLDGKAKFSVAELAEINRLRKKKKEEKRKKNKR